MSKGLSSVKTLTAKEIAKKWNLPLAVVSKKIAAGIKVEKEHTKSTGQANEIARDHLGERPDYYDKLGQMEKKKVKIKENTSVTGVAGLGFNTGVPAVDDDNGYITTNALAKDSMNGAIMDFVNKHHQHLHDKTSFKEYNPKKIKMSSNKDLAESLGSDYGTAAVPVTGDLTGSPRKVAKIDEVNLKKITDKISPKVKKKIKNVAAATALASNAIAGAGAFQNASMQQGSPTSDAVNAAAGLPGKVGYAFFAGKSAKSGFDMAKEHIRSKQKLKEDLRKWFREKWVRYDTKGNIKGPCARDEGEGKPKCRPLASARAMSKDERAKSARRKRREDPVADRPGKGGKPVMVRTEETLMEKNVPTNPALWARAKAQARAKFDVYPSAYANGWASKWYKSKGGGWKTAANESIEEACWDTHKQEGMKKKGGKMVPNCVPKEEKSIVPANTTERGIYEDQIDEIKASTVGSAVAKAAAERKDITSKKMGKEEIAKWWKRERLVRAGVNKLSGKSKVPASTEESWTPFFPPHHKHSARLSKEKSNKPDIIMDPGAGGTTKTIHEVKQMDTKDIINEALDNILDENLVAMKENFMTALQEKAMEKLEERKKIIASEYFAQ